MICTTDLRPCFWAEGLLDGEFLGLGCFWDLGAFGWGAFFGELLFWGAFGGKLLGGVLYLRSLCPYTDIYS